jgi:type I site-specific restriction-modification system R (restriction) subunit
VVTRQTTDKQLRENIKEFLRSKKYSSAYSSKELKESLKGKRIKTTIQNFHSLLTE